MSGSAPKLAVFDTTSEDGVQALHVAVKNAAQLAYTSTFVPAPPPPLDSGAVIPNDPAVINARLVIPDLSGAIARICKEGSYDRDQVENACVGLSLGHLMLSGPPGTGKTRLARDLANAFMADSRFATANPEWSVYDTIGSQTLAGAMQTVPRHGVVTRAIIESHERISQHLKQENGPQATWLVIDEVNRADIDRAFGPLFSAISAGPGGAFPLDYMSSAPVLTIPLRFRIIATLNSFDTRFVNSMSAALRRRFARALVLPPANDKSKRIPEHEFDVSLKEAMHRATAAFGNDAPKLAKGVEDFRSQIREVFGSLREPVTESGNPLPIGIPVGTAQLIDTVTYAIGLMALAGVPNTADDFWKVFDRALSASLANSFESDHLRGRITRDFVAGFTKQYGQVPKFLSRLEAFLLGKD